MKEVNDGELVIKEILRYANISESTFLEKDKKTNIMVWRKIAAYILYNYCFWTHKKIAERLGYGDRKTSEHHVTTVNYWMKNHKYAPRDLPIATRNIINNLGL